MLEQWEKITIAKNVLYCKEHKGTSMIHNLKLYFIISLSKLDTFQFSFFVLSYFLFVKGSHTHKSNKLFELFAKRLLEIN